MFLRVVRGGSQGVKLPEKALRDIREWPTPSDKKEVGTLLGFLGYYREFIPEFACLTAGMSSLRSKNVVFKWTQEHEDTLYPPSPLLGALTLVVYYLNRLGQASIL